MSEQKCPVCEQSTNDIDTTPTLLAAVREQIDLGKSDTEIIESTRRVLAFCREFDRRWAELEATPYE